MTNGEIDTEIPFKEMLLEVFLCKYDPKLIIFKHDKFFLSKDVTTGITFASCVRCGAVYQLEDGNLTIMEKKPE